MSETPARPARRSRLLAVTVVALCALGVGAGACRLLAEPGGKGGCEALLDDKRVQRALGGGSPEGTNCAELGAAVRKATVGAGPGRHSVTQARAMRDVLMAVDDTLRSPSNHLDPALRLPFAESLADYSADTQMILGITTGDYVRRAFSSEPAWEDENGVHMSLPTATVERVLRELSQDAAAYVALRTATAREGARELNAVRRDPTGAEPASPMARNARVLGFLDAVAEKRQDDTWTEAVFRGLAAGPATPPAYGENPVDHIVVSWQGVLRTGAADPLSALQRQSADMTDIWAKALGIDEKEREGLRRKAFNSSASSRISGLRELK
ncbi:hypothetical protein ACVNF4_04485 [Streptomyces sp. S6]